MGVAPPLAPAPPSAPRPRRATRAVAAGPAMWWATLLTAGALCFITFYAKGGLNLESMTTTELVLTLACALAAAIAVLLAPAGKRAYGAWPAGLLLGGLWTLYGVQTAFLVSSAAALVGIAAFWRWVR